MVFSGGKSGFYKIIHNPSNTLFMRLSCPAALLPDSLIDNRLIVLILIFFYRLLPQDLILYYPQKVVVKILLRRRNGNIDPQKVVVLFKGFFRAFIFPDGFFYVKMILRAAGRQQDIKRTIYKHSCRWFPS